MLRLVQIAVALFMAAQVAAQVAELATTYISPALEEIHAALPGED